MALIDLLFEPAIVTSRNPTGTRDAYGLTQTTPSTRDTICYHHQTFSSETGFIVDQTWSAYFPPGDPLTASDKVTINGVDYEIVGGPWQTENPRTTEPWQVEAQLRRTDG